MSGVPPWAMHSENPVGKPATNNREPHHQGHNIQFATIHHRRQSIGLDVWYISVEFSRVTYPYFLFNGYVKINIHADKYYGNTKFLYVSNSKIGLKHTLNI